MSLWTHFFPTPWSVIVHPWLEISLTVSIYPWKSANTTINQNVFLRAGTSQLCSQIWAWYLTDILWAPSKRICKWFRHVLLDAKNIKGKVSEWFHLTNLIWQLNILMFIYFKGSRNVLIDKITLLLLYWYFNMAKSIWLDARYKHVCWKYAFIFRIDIKTCDTT